MLQLHRQGYGHSSNDRIGIEGQVPDATTGSAEDSHQWFAFQT